MFATATKVLTPAKSLVRAHGRGLLLSTLEKETLLTKIMVLPDGRFIAETKGWDSYWEPLGQLGCQEAEDALSALHFAWRDYLRSGFGLCQRKEFCFRYFSLLNVLLHHCKETAVTHVWARGLQTVLGFECFSISSEVSDSEVLGAGTCTLRNPCYLLAKLKMPDIPDDPQFLPIITVSETAKPELFYHHRQYALSADSPMSLLLYLAVSEANRSASFKLLNALAGSVSYAIDPWTRERAERLCQGILCPIVLTNKTDDSKTIWLEFVDVGAGSGSLTSTLCCQLRVLSTSHGLTTKFRMWFVDLEPADPARFFRTKRLRDLTDSLTYLGDDYRKWLNKPQPLPATSGLRIALVSRLLNNLSRFSIRRLSRDDLLPHPSRAALPLDSDAYLPSVCLANSGKGVEALVISNARVPLPDGRTFPQISLSEFYRGLYIISDPKGTINVLEEGIFLPVRTFNPECLLTTGGKSIISCLVENCDYVVIEDADLRPQDLVDHMAMFSLHSITIQGVTKVLGLTGNHAYVAWSKAKAAKPDLSGEGIW